MWGISRSLNGLKREKLEAAELKKYFGIDSFIQGDLDLLKEEIEDKLFRGSDRVRYFGNLAVLCGLLGTALGLASSLADVAGLTSTDGIMSLLPKIGSHLSLAFVATIVGICVNIPIQQMFRFVRSAALDLKLRIFRSISEHAKTAGGTDAQAASGQ